MQSVAMSCCALAPSEKVGRKPSVGASVSVNVSPWQLFAPEFVATVREIVSATRTPPPQVTIEITESALLHDLNDRAHKMR